MKKGLPKKPKQAADPEKVKGPEAFDFIHAINFTKDDIIRSSDSPEAMERIYSPFLTNHSLSFHIATLFDANMMNQAAHLTNQMQFDCLRVLVRREKRYSKWYKPVVEADVKLIQEIYACNYSRAAEIRRLLSDEQMKALIDSRYTGGR